MYLEDNKTEENFHLLSETPCYVFLVSKFRKRHEVFYNGTMYETTFLFYIFIQFSPCVSNQYLSGRSLNVTIKKLLKI